MFWYSGVLLVYEKYIILNVDNFFYLARVLNPVFIFDQLFKWRGPIFPSRWFRENGNINLMAKTKHLLHNLYEYFTICILLFQNTLSCIFSLPSRLMALNWVQYFEDTSLCGLFYISCQCLNIEMNFKWCQRESLWILFNLIFNEFVSCVIGVKVSHMVDWCFLWSKKKNPFPDIVHQVVLRPTTL